MEALEKNGTLDVVELPKEKSLVGCKWVFIVKYKAGGSLESYKVRLVGAKIILKHMEVDTYQHCT